ncbi:MAG: rhodanese-like domain-containing protein [Chlorobiota bacterium]|jgi:rhodanese-related sulfurtransferase
MLGFFKNMTGQADNGELKKLIDEGAYIVDVRTPGEFSEGSVKGAVNIPLDDLSDNLDKFKGKKGIVVFCRSGARSGSAKSILEQNGFENVINGGSVGNVNSVI